MKRTVLRYINRLSISGEELSFQVKGGVIHLDTKSVKLTNQYLKKILMTYARSNPTVGKLL